MSDFKDFENISGVQPPKHIYTHLRSQFDRELNPAVSGVMLKFGALHMAGSSLTLTLCPQFGFGLLEGHGLMQYFMNLGPHLCSVLCGAFFVSFTLILARVVLTKYERATVVRNRRIFATSFLSLSLGSLVMLGAEFTILPVLFWLVGAVMVMETMPWTIAPAVSGRKSVV
jgi:hypothetical protein